MHENTLLNVLNSTINRLGKKINILKDFSFKISIFLPNLLIVLLLIERFEGKYPIVQWQC